MTDEMVLTRLPLSRRLVRWSGSTNSEPVDISDGSVARLYLPSISGTTLKIDCLIDEEAGTWARLYYEGAEVAISVSSGVHVMPPELFAANGKIRFVSDASETVDAYYYPVT